METSTEKVSKVCAGCRCKVLGKSTPTEGLLLTISPCPSVAPRSEQSRKKCIKKKEIVNDKFEVVKVLKKFGHVKEYRKENSVTYGDMLPEEQKECIVRVLQELITLCKCFIVSACVHFEFNKSGEVHAHAYCKFDAMDKCDLNCVNLSKAIHKVFGKSGVSHKVCTNIKYTGDDISHIINYLNKDNDLPPVFIHRPDIRVYLTDKKDDS